MLVTLLAIMDSVSQPLHKTVDKLKCSFSNRLIQLCCLKEQHIDPSYLVLSDFITLTPKHRKTFLLYIIINVNKTCPLAPYVPLTFNSTIPQHFIHLNTLFYNYLSILLYIVSHCFLYIVYILYFIVYLFALVFWLCLFLKCTAQE